MTRSYSSVTARARPGVIVSRFTIPADLLERRPLRPGGQRQRLPRPALLHGRAGPDLHRRSGWSSRHAVAGAAPGCGARRAWTGRSRTNMIDKASHQALARRAAPHRRDVLAAAPERQAAQPQLLPAPRSQTPAGMALRGQPLQTAPSQLGIAPKEGVDLCHLALLDRARRPDGHGPGRAGTGCDPGLPALPQLAQAAQSLRPAPPQRLQPERADPGAALPECRLAG